MPHKRRLFAGGLQSVRFLFDFLRDNGDGNGEGKMELKGKHIAVLAEDL